MEPVDPVDIEAGGPRNQAAVAVRSDKSNCFCLKKYFLAIPGRSPKEKANYFPPSCTW